VARHDVQCFHLQQQTNLCQKRKWFYCEHMGLTAKKRKLTQHSRCQITVSSLMATEVQSRTGFQDVQELLCYVALVCGRKIDVMMCSHLYLSWFEEWFAY